MAASSLKLTDISKTLSGRARARTLSFECLAGEIHAVLGENGSGKSTLLGIASGSVTPDGGVIEIMGKPLKSADPLLARGLGLATVYQDDSLVRELTVAQNLFLGGARRCAVLRRHERLGRASSSPPTISALAPDALVGDLTPAERQFLEIVKALIARPKVLLLDEPTSTLDLDGVKKLAAIVRRLAAEGTAIVYVSHRLPEILDLADRVTILRDGIGRGTYEISEALSEKDLIALMVGRSIEAEYPQRASALEPTGVCCRSPDSQRRQFPRRLVLRSARGEILGFAGAEGNGQRDVIRALGGLQDAPAHGFVQRQAVTHRRAARRDRRRPAVPQRRPLAGVDIPRARRAREHDAAGARPLRQRRPCLGAQRSRPRRRRWSTNTAS